VSSARYAMVIGVLALAGALIAGPAAAAAKVRTVPTAGTVTIGAVRCVATEACVVKPQPKQVDARVAGKKVKARVLVPAFLGAGGKGPVKLRFGSGALERLAGHSATFRAKVMVRGSGKKSTSSFKAQLKRPASAPTKPGTPGGPTAPGTPGTPGTPGLPGGEVPRSEPISGEPAPLARPLTAKTVESVSLKWYPRASWLNYVATGEGTTTANGASSLSSTTQPCPAAPGTNEGSGTNSGVNLPYEISFAPAESWFDPATNTASISGTGSVSFRFKAHTINLTGSDPEIQLTPSTSNAIFRFSGSEGTPYPNQRVSLLTFPTPTPTITGNTYTYNLLRTTLTPNGEKVFAGFYTAPLNNGFGCLSASFVVP
jgi:hypothetical protein